VVSLTLITTFLLAFAPPASAPPAAPAPTTSAAAAPAAKPPAAAAAAVPKPAAEPRGSVVIALPEEARTLGTYDAYSSIGQVVLRNTNEALLNRDPVTMELVPELATRWEQVNSTTWRFTLRQGVMFHDGSPLTAEAAAFGLTHMFDKANAFGIRNRLGPELTFRPVDEYTLEVVSAAPDPIVPSRLVFPVLPSMKALKEHPEEYQLKPVGTGPYKFVEWVKGQHIKVTANPDWWGRTATAGEARGVLTIKDATFLARAEREVRLAMLNKGEADLGRWLIKEQCAQAPQCVTGPGLEFIFVRLDQPNPALADRRIREAIALAIDKNAIINDIMGGGTLTGQVVGPTAVGYHPDLKLYPYDLARAKALVAEAKADGVPVDVPFQVVARRAGWVRIEEAAEAITEMVRQAGLPNVKTVVLEAALHQELWMPNQWPGPERGMIGLHSLANDIFDFDKPVVSNYGCSGVSSAYCNPRVDELEKTASTLSGEQRNKALQEINKILYDDIAAIPVGMPEFYFGMSRRLEWKTRLDANILLKEMTLKE
jgi:peptide/nickel transport system substrate-binding protein